MRQAQKLCPQPLCQMNDLYLNLIHTLLNKFRFIHQNLTKLNYHILILILSFIIIVILSIKKLLKNNKMKNQVKLRKGVHQAKQKSLERRMTTEYTYSVFTT